MILKKNNIFNMNLLYNKVEKYKIAIKLKLNIIYLFLHILTIKLRYSIIFITRKLYNPLSYGYLKAMIESSK